MMESLSRKRSLYECFNAKVLGDNIYCGKGHHLGNRQDGTVGILRLERGNPLILTACQSCPDFYFMGDPIPAKEKGWIKPEASWVNALHLLKGGDEKFG